MAHPLIDKNFYDAILRFEESDEAQETYYRVMASTVERNGKIYSVRDQILRAYAMLFCDDGRRASIRGTGIACSTTFP